MSTYNGEKYLEEQLFSIQKQVGVHITLLLRDDGSTDRTIMIAHKFEKDIDMVIVEGNNIGCENSFMELLKNDISADYYAFADQDDIWDVDKLFIGIQEIKKYQGPALYGCNLREYKNGVVTKNIFSQNKFNRVITRAKRDYVSNVHGCTLIWNKQLNSIIKSYQPNHIVPHDLWVCTIANLVGYTFYDYNTHLNYRIHDNNVSGHANNKIERIKKGIKLYLGKNHRKMSEFGSEILNGYSMYFDKTSEGYFFIYNIAKYKQQFLCKINLLNSEHINELKIEEKIFWKICILFNRY